MTPLRFRIWDTAHRRFFKPTFAAYEGRLEELLLSPSGQLSMRTMDGMTHESIFPGRFVMQQWTGLTDKNGKEIFEGDVVRGIDGACAQVIWDNGSFVLSGEGVKSSFPARVSLWLTMHPENLEILGNVFQHPFLLSLPPSP